MKRVLIVDDSTFARKLIGDILLSTGEFEIVGTATNGLEALSLTHKLHPDVITLDIAMPVMNGLDTLARIMEECPTPVIVISCLTDSGGDISIKALDLGAIDVVAKTKATGMFQLRGIADELIVKVSIAAHANMGNARKIRCRQPRPATPSIQRKSFPVTPIIIIASSTGGPKALRYIVPRLDTSIQASYFVVQHLPIGFTAYLARDLDTLTELNVREAQTGDRPSANSLFIAPAGKHCAFTRDGKIDLTDEPPLWGVRPSADITMATAGTVFKSIVIGIVLTGMGRDGAHGMSIIKANGGTTIAEHESSCVVYGMPKAVIDTGSADKIVPLEEIPDAIFETIASVVANCNATS